MKQPRRCPGQRCRHFARTLPVTPDKASGSIAFSGGMCRLAATEAAPVMTLDAADAAAPATLEDVVARHVPRFAFRGPPAIHRTPAAS